jgi:hypothetical protein
MEALTMSAGYVGYTNILSKEKTRQYETQGIIEYTVHI